MVDVADASLCVVGEIRSCLTVMICILSVEFFVFDVKIIYVVHSFFGYTCSVDAECCFIHVCSVLLDDFTFRYNVLL